MCSRPPTRSSSKNRWNWKGPIYVWGPFGEEQHGVHVRKQGSSEDFFTLLYPRAAGQGPAEVTLLEGGRGITVTHLEGKDVVLLSPGKPTAVTSGDLQLTGEVTFARRYANRTLRLAVVKGTEATATQPPWRLRSDGPVAVSIQGRTLHGESSGNAHVAEINLPPACTVTAVAVDDKPIEAHQARNVLTLHLPAGYHTFTIKTRGDRQ